MRRAFTLIELIVVIAIISILAAILFPVFAQARDKARGAACMSNMKQIGLAVQQYVQDYDERLFFRASKDSTAANLGKIRSGAVIPGTDTVATASAQWYNVLMPYIKSTDVYNCPSDTAPTASATPDGSTLPRSYAAADSAEDLQSSQVAVPADTIVVTEKWEKSPAKTVPYAVAANNETWFEVWDGDMIQDPTTKEPRMLKYASRHRGFMNCAFFDGHAKALTPNMIWKSADLTGCTLIHNYPSPILPTSSRSKCDGTDDCASTAASGNICASFTYP